MLDVRLETSEEGADAVANQEEIAMRESASGKSGGMPGGGGRRVALEIPAVCRWWSSLTLTPPNSCISPRGESSRV
jgi:hypothetical protein